MNIDDMLRLFDNVTQCKAKYEFNLLILNVFTETKIDERKFSHLNEIKWKLKSNNEVEFIANIKTSTKNIEDELIKAKLSYPNCDFYMKKNVDNVHDDNEHDADESDCYYCKEKVFIPFTIYKYVQV